MNFYDDSRVRVVREEFGADGYCYQVVQMLDSEKYHVTRIEPQHGNLRVGFGHCTGFMDVKRAMEQLGAKIRVVEKQTERRRQQQFYKENKDVGIY